MPCFVVVIILKTKHNRVVCIFYRVYWYWTKVTPQPLATLMWLHLHACWPFLLLGVGVGVGLWVWVWVGIYINSYIWSMLPDLLCFVVVSVWLPIPQGCFTSTRAIIQLIRCQSGNLEDVLTLLLFLYNYVNDLLWVSLSHNCIKTTVM